MNTDHPTAAVLLAEIAKGKILVITSATHIMKVDQACVDRFDLRGRPVLKNSTSTKKLLIAKGERYIVLDKYNHKLELV